MQEGSQEGGVASQLDMGGVVKLQGGRGGGSEGGRERREGGREGGRERGR